MEEKDIAARELENINVIFADIVNAFFAMNGINKHIDPADLRDARARTSYKDGGALRDQERDVVKYWMGPDAETIICLLGMENQSGLDTYAALRVVGYDGANYRAQVPPKRKKGKRYRVKKLHGVLSLILYFGTRRRWPKRRSLLERIGVPEELRPFMTETPVNVIELAFLTEEQEALFKSDFRHVVRLLRRERLGADKLDMLPGEIQYAKELLDLLFSLTGDQRFKNAIAQAVEMQKKGESIKLTSFLEQAEMKGIEKGRREMTSFLEQAEMKGIERGRAEGRSEGLERGIERGRAEAQQVIRDRLIANGISPQDAARFTALSL